MRTSWWSRHANVQVEDPKQNDQQNLPNEQPNHVVPYDHMIEVKFTTGEVIRSGPYDSSMFAEHDRIFSAGGSLLALEAKDPPAKIFISYQHVLYTKLVKLPEKA